MRFVTLNDVQKVFGEGVFILLEPAEHLEKKSAAGKLPEAWSFSVDQGRVCRGDNKFHALGVEMHAGGYPVACVVEEPGVPTPEDGSPRVVGHVIVDVDAQGRVAARRNKGLNGEILELKPSSVSKGELDQSGAVPTGYVEANPQRIKGVIAVYVHNVDTHPEGALALTPQEFAAQSTDGRSLSALLKAGLLK